MISTFLFFKSSLTMPSNVLPLHFKQIFLPIISIFPEGEGDGFESRLPLKIFSALPVMEDGGIDRTVIDCWQHQMGQIANFSPLLTYFYFLKSKSLM